MFSKKNIILMGLASSLSGSILGLAYLGFYLVEKGLISKELSLIVIILYVFYVLYMMVRYAVSKKN